MERDGVPARLSIMDFSFVFVGADTSDATAHTGGPAISYGFGSGDGTVSQWSSAADVDLSGDGVSDAVQLDFDGDGRRDDAMWDSDGDGRADLVALDTDDDGTPDSCYSDTGRGLWDHLVDDARPGAPPTDPAPAASDGPGREKPGQAADLDADGIDDDRVVDVGASGRAEIGLVFAGSDTMPARVLVDLDADGQFDAALIDDDSDGCADVWATRGQVRFDEVPARD